jgi:hypothetical protein
MLLVLRLVPRRRESSTLLIIKFVSLVSGTLSAGGENQTLCMKARAEIDARTVSSMIESQVPLGISKYSKAWCRERS